MTPVASYTKNRNLDYFDNLLADPNGGIQKLFRKYAVHAADASVGYTVPTVGIDDVTHVGNFTRGSVPDNKLVSWVHMEKLSRNSGPKPEGHDVLYLEANINPKPNWIPCYFLPWAPQAMVQMTIPVQGTRLNGAPDPSIFFTAAINGCSVFIQGSAANPTVYHCGGDPDYATKGLRDPDEAATFWRNLVLQHGDPGALRGEVNKTHYVMDAISPTADMKSTPTSRRYEEWIKSEMDKTIRIKEVKPWGCVFGIRTGLLWKFYLQENVTIKFATVQKQKFALNLRSRKIEVDIKETGRPAVVREIFPDGGACVNFTPLRPISML